VPKVEVNPALEMVPPIARSVEVKELKSGQNGRILVVADFGPGTLKTKFHAVRLDNETVVLRDDGKGGDEAASDGRFSVAISEDLDAVTKQFAATEQRSLIGFKPRPTFRGRELIPPDSTATARFDFQRFQRGGFIPLDLDKICFLQDISIPHSLMVTDVRVVEDFTRANNPCSASPSATGAWSFGKLMTDMANPTVTGVSAEDFVRHWLDTWLHLQTVNGDPVPARTRLFALVIQPWVVRSGSPAGSFTINSWMTKPLDLAKAPFKLTAIVNRLDLRGNSGYGFANPGEGRFIFEVLDPNTCTPLGAPKAFTVIFEYGLPIHTCKGLKVYAQKWADLKSFTLGPGPYNDKLQELTDVFAKANAAPAKPNGSAINQIRTNEIVLSSGTPQPVWELREFNVDPVSHLLFETTVKQEPAKKYNARAVPPGAPSDVTLMADWVNLNHDDIVNDRHTVPLSLPTGQPFLGGKSHTEFLGFWDAAPSEITLDGARQHFSLNTCSGCHGGETNTQFLHVGRASFGFEAPLSGFLTGVTVTDPAGRPASPGRSFNDLERRQQSMQRLLCQPCTSRLFALVNALTFKPVHMSD